MDERGFVKVQGQVEKFQQPLEQKRSKIGHFEEVGQYRQEEVTATSDVQTVMQNMKHQGSVTSPKKKKDDFLGTSSKVRRSVVSPTKNSKQPF